MTQLCKVRMLYVHKWVSSKFVDRHRVAVLPLGSLFNTGKSPRFYGRKRLVETEDCNSSNICRATRNEAQAALLEYLHSTRSLQYMDAEHLSKNSPHFLEKLLGKVNTGENVQQSIARFLRYHPINEFEPFFESSGLNPIEYGTLLPRDLMFLSDDDLLLENYHVLCNYGIARNKVGKIYKEAAEVFRYDYGVLALKLKAYEKLGLNQLVIGKAVICCPNLLIGNVNRDFVKVVDMLKEMGIEFSWIKEHLSENCVYSWSRLLALLKLFGNIGYSEEQLGMLIRQHPSILFDGSGDRTFSLMGFLFKFGCTMDQIHSVLLQFPQMQIGKFVMNMRQCFLFMNEIEMRVNDIGKIICSHTLMLGNCALKKTSSLLSSLNVGKKRLSEFVLVNPEQMKKWVIGSRIDPLPSERLRSQMHKTKFLLDLGFVENSSKMEKALKIFRGKGSELQERFDCIVKAGLDRKDVCEMIRTCPQILNLKKDVIKMKINFLVNDLGYPISSIVGYPAYLICNTQTVKLRLGMYNWLKDQGTVDSVLALSTVTACSEKIFVKEFVERHPKGLEIWQDLKKRICSE